MAKSSTAVQGYSPAIVINKSIVNSFLCGLCKLLLKDPYQADCGHRFCKNCLENLPSEEPCSKCKEEGEEECEMLSKTSGRKDPACIREMSKISVKCDFTGCSWDGVFKEYETHFTECKHRPLLDGVCPFKCTEEKMTGAALTEHLKLNITKHIEILLRRLSAIEELSRTDRTDGATNNSKETSREIVKLEEKVKDLQLKLKNGLVQSKSSSTNLSASESTSKKLTECENGLSTISEQIKNLYDKYDRRERPSNEDSKKDDELQERLRKLEIDLALKDARLAELYVHLESLEQTTHNGTLVWRIQGMKQKRADAQSGKVPSIYSPPFYTSKNGYKMCARLYLNGDGVGKGSHISLFFVILRGTCDPLLLWPFRQKVTFMFIDQKNKSHVIDAFLPDAQSSSFQKPKSDMNIASGCPSFISFDRLDSTEHAYIKDDVAFIKIAVSLDGIEPR